MIVLKERASFAVVTSRGHLNPGDPDVVFERFPIGLERLVRHVWIVRWDIPNGDVRSQRVLTYPTCNIVVTPDGAALYGPDPRVNIRELSGCSWAVGVLLRPAAARVLTDTPARSLVGRHEPAPSTPQEAISLAMSTGSGRGKTVGAAKAVGATDLATAAGKVGAVVSEWLAPFADQIGPVGMMVNRVSRIAEEREDVVRVAHLAELAGVPIRTLTRLVHDHVGMTPKWLIECRRLQQAATTLYGDPDRDLATLAHNLGYADQAHFTRRYHEALGETPGQTRRAGRQAKAPGEVVSADPPWASR